MSLEELEVLNEKNEEEMTSSTTIEFGKHPCKEGLNRVVGNSTTKRIRLLWTY